MQEARAGWSGQPEEKQYLTRDTHSREREPTIYKKCARPSSQEAIQLLCIRFRQILHIDNHRILSL
jgi:hypothetical protein